MTVAVPTLSADEALLECIRSLETQTYPHLEVIVIDNSGDGRVRRAGLPRRGIRVIENQQNVGFGRAINQAYHASTGAYLATLNDDAVARPRWAEALVHSLESDPAVGMAASQVLLAAEGTIDSAGMRIAGDASSKQRGHGQDAAGFREPAEVLLPSGSAAIYRRAMLDRIGVFDDDFFLYCEDTDLGLRARWAGWRCRYVPEAQVEHRYSHSAGRVSSLKAYYVERNRLFVAVKNFPLSMLWRVPFLAAERYFWHWWLARKGQGVAGRYTEGGALHLGWLVIKAHLALLAHARRLWQQRRAIRRMAQVSAGEFVGLLAQHEISVREVAAL